MLTKTCSSQELATHASLVITHKLAKNNKPFSDGEFPKECVEATVKIVCPEIEAQLKNVSLSRKTIDSIVRRAEAISHNLEDQLVNKIKEFVCCSVCLDESTDIADTA